MMLAVAIAVLLSVIAADSPAKVARGLPPGQRVLKGDDAKQAAGLMHLIADSKKAERWPEAIAAAKELTSLRRERQGLDHWETFDAERTQRDLEMLAKMPANDAKELLQADQFNDEVVKGDRKQAMVLAEKANAIWRRLLPGDHPSLALGLSRVGEFHRTRGDYAKAEPLLLEALARVEKSLPANHPEIARTLTYVAALYLVQGQLRKAEQYFLRALALREQALPADHLDITRSLSNLAVLYRAMGELAKAEAHNLRALAILERTLPPVHIETAMSLSNLALVYRTGGELAKAAPISLRAHLMIEKLLPPNHPDIAISLNNLGAMYYAQGAYAKVEPLFLRALAVRERVLPPGHPDIATCLNNLAMLYYSLGANDKMEPLLLRALAIREQGLSANHPNTADTLHNLSALYRDRGDYGKALSYMERAMAVREKSLPPDHPKIASTMNHLATLYRDRGDLTKAEPLYLRSIALAEKAMPFGHEDLARSLNHLGSFYQDQRSYAKAEESYLRALTLREKTLPPGHPDLAISLNNLALLHHIQGAHAKAESLYERLAAQSELGRAHLAPSGAQRVSAGLQSVWRVHYAVTQMLLKKPAAAATLEHGFARGLWDDALARQQRRLTTAERAKASEFQDRLGAVSRTIDSLAQRPKRTDAQEKTLTDLRQRQSALLTDSVEFERGLDQRYGVQTGKPYAWERIQKQIPADAALVGWLDAHDEHWALVVRHQGPPAFVPLGGVKAAKWTKDEARLADRAAAALPVANASVAMVSVLAKQRLAPLEIHFAPRDGQPAVRHLVVLPSAALLGVPIAALTDKYTIGYAPSGTIFAWLGENRAAFQNRQTGKPPTALALGDPRYSDAPSQSPRANELAFAKDAKGATTAKTFRGGKTWKPLPDTRREVAAIAETVARVGGTAKTLVGTDATEMALDTLARSDQLKRYRYIHLATHGEANVDVPFASSLVLNQTGLPDSYEQFKQDKPIYDGLLSAAEILGHWTLDADLVVLSACSTARGKDYGVEGTQSFAPALLLAGARSVIVSLWEVDDIATSLLMQRLYQNLLGQRPGLTAPMSKAMALKDAQDWLKNLTADAAKTAEQSLPRGLGTSRLVPAEVAPGKRSAATDRPYAHPYFWAAFVLVGEP